MMLTWVLAIVTSRGVFRPSLQRSPWLLPLEFAPRWAFVTLNLAFYAFQVWGYAELFRRTRGKERLVVAGFCSNLLLFLIQCLRPAAAAAVQYVKVAFMVLAFGAAALIFIESPAKAGVGEGTLPK